MPTVGFYIVFSIDPIRTLEVLADVPEILNAVKKMVNQQYVGLVDRVILSPKLRIVLQADLEVMFLRRH